jgi:hypothetical protein
MDLVHFNEVFSPLGFVIESSDEIRVSARVDAKDFGVYLSVLSDTFNVELVYHHIQSYLFMFQHYESFEEIYKLLQSNHILSEQLFEKFGLSIYT